jgi:hypothetical protein
MILRCLHCESEDVLAHTRLDYANDSKQLLAHAIFERVD